MRCLCHVMRQVESTRETVQLGKTPVSEMRTCSLCGTSRHQQIAVIGGQCRSRADNLQPGTVEAGRVTPYARTAILKSIIRCRIGNQCSSRRTYVICCRLPVRMISRAAAFCTDWSFCSRLPAIPHSRLLQ